MCQNNYTLFYPALQTNLSGDVPVFGQTVLHVLVWEWVSFVYHVYLILFSILKIAQCVLVFNLFYYLSAISIAFTWFPNVHIPKVWEHLFTPKCYLFPIRYEHIVNVVFILCSRVCKAISACKSITYTQTIKFTFHMHLIYLSTHTRLGCCYQHE